jgi:hypothetical protein
MPWPRSGAGGAGCGSCGWLTWRHRCRPPPSVACCCCSLRSRRQGRGGVRVGRRCRAAGRCRVHVGRGVDFGARKLALFVRIAPPSGDRFAPQNPLRAPICQANGVCTGRREADAALAPPVAPAARAYGARPRPQLPAVGPRAERAAATSHGRGRAATAAPCKPPTASASRRRRLASPDPSRARAKPDPDQTRPDSAGPSSAHPGRRRPHPAGALRGRPGGTCLRNRDNSLGSRAWIR